MRVLLTDLPVPAVDDKFALFLLSELAATLDRVVLGVEGLLFVACDFQSPGVSLWNYMHIAHTVPLPGREPAKRHERQARLSHVGST